MHKEYLVYFCQFITARMAWIIRNKWMLAGVLAGALAGFFYWKWVGCLSGTCLITSKWPNSTGYGALMGGILFSMFDHRKSKEQD